MTWLGAAVFMLSMVPGLGLAAGNAPVLGEAQYTQTYFDSATENRLRLIRVIPLAVNKVEIWGMAGGCYRAETPSAYSYPMVYIVTRADQAKFRRDDLVVVGFLKSSALRIRRLSAKERSEYMTCGRRQ